MIHLFDIHNSILKVVVSFFCDLARAQTESRNLVAIVQFNFLHFGHLETRRVTARG